MRENVHVLCKYYTRLTNNDKNALPLSLSGIPPTNDENGIDIGEDVFSGNIFFR